MRFVQNTLEQTVGATQSVLSKKGNIGSSTGDRASSSGLCDDSHVNILNHKKICV
jgi:hypothetical protein